MTDDADDLDDDADDDLDLDRKGLGTAAVWPSIPERRRAEERLSQPRLRVRFERDGLTPRYRLPTEWLS